MNVTIRYLPRYIYVLFYPGATMLYVFMRKRGRLVNKNRFIPLEGLLLVGEGWKFVPDILHDVKQTRHG